MKPFISIDFVMTILPHAETGLSAVDARRVVAEAVEFARADIEKAPLHIVLPLVILSAVFAGWMKLTGLFLPQAKAVALWEKIGGFPARTFLRVVRSLTLLSFSENPRVVEKTGGTHTTKRHSHYRALRDEMMGAA